MNVPQILWRLVKSWLVIDNGFSGYLGSVTEFGNTVILD